MSTSTKREPHARKHKLATRLTVAIGNEFVIRFSPGHERSEEQRDDGAKNPSLGHLWYAEVFNEHAIDEDPCRIWLDDRQGDVGKQLAEALREKAAMYSVMAAKFENEIKKTAEAVGVA